MNFAEWKQLTDTQRETIMREWDVYGQGYWHELNSQAVNDFQMQYGGDIRIKSISGGVFHGGHLIVGVSKTIPWDEMLELPEWYFGFRVIQLGTESK